MWLGLKGERHGSARPIGVIERGARRRNREGVAGGVLRPSLVQLLLSMGEGSFTPETRKEEEVGMSIWLRE